MRRKLASGLVACGWVLLAVACSKEPESRATLGDTLVGTDTSTERAGVINARVEYRQIPCEIVALRGAVEKEVGAGGDVVEDGYDSLVVAAGVVPQGEIYVFKMSRKQNGELELTGTPKNGGTANFQEPTDRNQAKFKLTIDYSDCKSPLPGVALSQDEKVIVLPIEIQPNTSVTAELEHLSTYAVAAPGYTSGGGSLQEAPAQFRGVVPDTMQMDTAAADTSAR